MASTYKLSTSDEKADQQIEILKAIGLHDDLVKLCKSCTPDPHKMVKEAVREAIERNGNSLDIFNEHIKFATNNVVVPILWDMIDQRNHEVLGTASSSLKVSPVQSTASPRLSTETIAECYKHVAELLQNAVPPNKSQVHSGDASHYHQLVRKASFIIGGKSIDRDSSEILVQEAIKAYLEGLTPNQYDTLKSANAYECGIVNEVVEAIEAKMRAIAGPNNLHLQGWTQRIQESRAAQHVLHPDSNSAEAITDNMPIKRPWFLRIADNIRERATHIRHPIP